MTRTKAKRKSSALKVGAQIRQRTAKIGSREIGKIAVLDRAAALLVALSHFTRPATLNEVAQKASLSKATAFRILSTLAEQGFVAQDASTSSYRLGIAPLHMAMAVLDGIDVHAKARPVMRAITEMLNETVVLSVRDGDYRVNIDAVECTNAISSSRRIGEPRPLRSGAASRVFMAVMSDDEIEAYLKRHRPTGKGEVGPAYLDNLWKDIRKARRTGLVSMPADFSPESLAVATIVYDPAGAPVAALHVAIPRGRFSPRVESRCGQALLRATAEITRELKS